MQLVQPVALLLYHTPPRLSISISKNWDTDYIT
jgi:hypothetical protein